MHPQSVRQQQKICIPRVGDGVFVALDRPPFDAHLVG